MEIELRLNKIDRLQLVEWFNGDETRRSNNFHDLNRKIQTDQALTVDEVKMLNDLDTPIKVHELIEHSNVILPKPIEPERSPELDKRCEQLKNMLQHQEYNSMVRNVNVAKHTTNEQYFGADIRAMNRQLLTIFNIVLTVGGAFMFGYVASGALAGAESRFEVKMISGCVLGTIVFFADLYFLLRSLDDNEPEKNDVKKKL